LDPGLDPEIAGKTFLSIQSWLS